MRVLVTRPEPDAGKTAAALIAGGHEPVVVPLLSIRNCAAAARPLEQALPGAQGVVFTSANGVRAFAALNPQRAVPVFAVGPASAAAARAAGFAHVHEGAGDSRSLRAAIVRHCDPAAGPLVHPAATHLSVRGAGALKAGLEACGFSLVRVVIYEARAAAGLPPNLVAHLRPHSASMLDAALFYSPRSAALFCDLVSRAALAPSCAGLRALCLSPSVAEALAPLVFTSVDVAPMSNEQALLGMLGCV